MVRSRCRPINNLSWTCRAAIRSRGGRKAEPWPILTTTRSSAMSAGSPKRYLPVKEWPEADRLLWERACGPADYFSDAGLAAKWTKFTRSNAEIAYGSYLLHLRDRAR